jgi:hypothetical protein
MRHIYRNLFKTFACVGPSELNVNSAMRYIKEPLPFLSTTRAYYSDFKRNMALKVQAPRIAVHTRSIMSKPYWSRP